MHGELREKSGVSRRVFLVAGSPGQAAELREGGQLACGWLWHPAKQREPRCSTQLPPLETTGNGPSKTGTFQAATDSTGQVAAFQCEP